MASQLKVDTITGVSTAGSIAITGEGNSTTTNLQQGLAKAFIRFNAGTSINDSFNVASLTDDGTGDYHYNFTNAMGNANYTHVGMGGNVGITDDTVTTALANIGAFNASGSATDDTRMNGHVTGDLA